MTFELLISLTVLCRLFNPFLTCGDLTISLDFVCDYNMHVSSHIYDQLDRYGGDFCVEDLELI